MLDFERNSNRLSVQFHMDGGIRSLPLDLLHCMLDKAKTINQFAEDLETELRRNPLRVAKNQVGRR